ncbi:MAG TPA: hypothetical protein VF389_04580, partial [Woeseiaceae bacterium]
MKDRTWKVSSGAGHRTSVARLTQLFAVGLLSAALALPAAAGPREQAKRIHDRLAGVPPSASVLAEMEADVDPF